MPTTVYFASDRKLTGTPDSPESYSNEIQPPSDSTQLVYGTGFVSGIDIAAKGRSTRSTTWRTAGRLVDDRFVLARMAHSAGPVPPDAHGRLFRGDQLRAVDDLVIRGGKVVPQMGFRNIYLGRSRDFAPGDVAAMDDATTRIMRDERLNNVIRQYFPGQTLSCDIAASVVLEEARPIEMDEPDVQAKLIDLFDRGLILSTDHDRTVFNLARIMHRGWRV